jgi:hypothetical protein
MAFKTDIPSQTEAAAEAPATPSLGIADIAFLLQIVEVCSQRGAFKADEMTSVGTVYDKVKAFIAANSPPTPADQAEGTE